MNHGGHEGKNQDQKGTQRARRRRKEHKGRNNNLQKNIRHCEEERRGHQTAGQPFCHA